MVQNPRSITSLSLTLLLCTLLAACASERLFDLRGVARLNGENLGQEGQSFERGKALLNKQSYGLAIAAFEQALADAGPSIHAYNGLGIAYSELGRAELGLRYFELALQLDPADASTLNNIGNAARRRGETELARRYLERASAHASAATQGRIERNLTALARLAPDPLIRLVATDPDAQPVIAARPAPVLVERIDEQRVRLITMEHPESPKPRPKLDDVIVCHSGLFNCGMTGNVPYQLSLSAII